MPCENLEGSALEDRIALVSGKKRIPLYCQWEITCRCNLKCVMCYTDCFNNIEDIATELDTDEILRIMDEMKKAGVLELTLTGGEPMARSDFKEIYIHAIKSGFLTTVFTNGTYINKKWIEVFNDYPPAMIEISYLGHEEKTFDQMTQKSGSFQRVQNAIRLILENKLPLTLKTTAMTVNEKEIQAIKKWARSLENVYFRLGTVIRRLANGDESSKTYQLPDEKLTYLIESDAELTEDDQKQKEVLRESPGCHSGFRRFHIDAYGYMQLCSDNRKKGYNLRTGSFKEGFFDHLPSFPCSNKIQNSNPEIRNNLETLTSS